MSAPNLLVLSDLHLGEEIHPRPALERVRRVRRVARELSSFLQHHARTREGGRPWRLVINGDLFDFIGICLMPSPGEPASADERRFGLGSERDRSIRKLAAIVTRHDRLFRRLAEFVAAGNDLIMVHGNHDAELHWPEVRAALVRTLGRLGAGAPAAQARIRFAPWFHHEPGLCYIEHGHQYDEYAALDSIVDPSCPGGGGIVPTMGQLAIRYLANAVPGADPHGHEAWTFSKYMRWTAQKGPRGIVHAFRCYGLLVARALAAGRALRRARRPALLREEHERVLAALARPTVLRDTIATARALFLDRFLVVALWMAAVALALAGGRFGLALGATGLALATHKALARRRTLDCRSKLARAARVLRHLMGVRYVVLGHSHDPTCESIGDGGWYFNSGSWLDSMRYVMILRDGPARLCEWPDGWSAESPESPAQRITGSDSLPR